METECEDICVSCDTLQRMTTSEENLKNYVDLDDSFLWVSVSFLP